jgi:hypothetical protein
LLCHLVQAIWEVFLTQGDSEAGFVVAHG